MQAFVTWAHRHPWWWLGLYLVGTAALYQFAIRVHLHGPIAIHPSALDEAIPVVPWSAWIYATYFLLMPSFVVLTRAHPERGRLLVTAGLCVVGNLTLNILIPTELAAPLTPETAGGGLLGQIVSGDTPRAALPSGHVALPLALAILAWRHRLPYGAVYIPWLAAMSIVVLTTKQHYLVDVIGGLAWGSVGPFVAARIASARVTRPR